MSESAGSFNPAQLEAHDPSLNHLAKVMFQKSADYLKGELLLMMVRNFQLNHMNKIPGKEEKRKIYLYTTTHEYMLFFNEFYL